MASLMPPGKQQYLTTSGTPLVGGKLYTYAAGTTSPLSTYSDKAGFIPNTNPVILDARGEASIFWGQAGYRAVLKDANDGLIWTQDNLYAIQDSSGVTFAQELIVATAGQTVFNLGISYIPSANSLAVYSNGLRLSSADFTETSASVVTLTVGADLGDELLFVGGSALGNLNNASLVSYVGPAGEAATVQNLAASSGASLVGYLPAGTGAVATIVQAKLRESVSAEGFGFNSGATAANNSTYLRAAIASGAKLIEIKTPGNYALDNTTPIQLNVNGVTLRLAVGVNIVPSVNTMTVFQVTGSNVTFEGGTITGDGTFPVDVAHPGPASPAGYYLAANTTAVIPGNYSTGRTVSFIEINGYGLTERQNAVIRGVTMVNPNCSGIMLYYTVGSACCDNRITSSYVSVFTLGFFLVSLYSCAYCAIDNNYLYGHVEGFVGGSIPSNTFNDYVLATALSNTRHITISNNQVANQIDHGIYMSNDADHTTVLGNKISNVVSGSGHAIKMYGSGVVIGNVTSTQRAAFNGRNSNNLAITGNSFQTNVISGVSSNNSVIYADCTGYLNEPLENITISGNTLVVAGRSPNGIYLYADKSPVDGTQQVIKNVTITGNTISGNIGATIAEDPLSAGIKLLQQDPTTGAKFYGENITISGNVVSTNLTGSYVLQYGVLLSSIATYLGYDCASIYGNTFVGYTSVGVCGNFKNSLISDNVFKPITAALSIKETSNANTPSGSNSYGAAIMTNDAGWWNLETGTSEIVWDRTYIDTNMIAGYSYLAARPYRHLVLFPTAARAITLVSGMGSVFQVGQIVTVHNYASSGGSNVDFASVAIVLPNTSKHFMCTGSNTFIQIW